MEVPSIKIFFVIKVLDHDISAQKCDENRTSAKYAASTVVGVFIFRVLSFLIFFAFRWIIIER